ncbi:MAG TPA: transposase [Roseiflexaceae bacterium]|nr:transposase [Roseiflexaceae bacterium]
MSCRAAVYQWQSVIATHLPHLSKPQAAVLALWSLGMVLAHSCALTAVTLVVATTCGRKEAAVRQQLREFCYEATAKAGQQRVALVVEDCFVPLLRWVLSWWQGTHLALALDATTLGQRFVVLAISVLYRGCAIPVAWCILPAQTKHAWRGEWLRLLRLLRPAIPLTWTVIVLADRGLYGGWLFRRIVRFGWHPLLRVTAGGTFRPEGSARFQRLATFAPAPGRCWRGRGTAFQERDKRLACTLLARWEEGCDAPWLLLTDLPPEACDACWYGLRAWIEQGFKLTKRGGWQWQRTRMTNPERAARLWLAVAVATLWLLSVGGEAEATMPASPVPDVAAVRRVAPRQRRATRLRLVSIVRRGWALVLAALLNQQRLPQGRLVPEPWPLSPRAPVTSWKVVTHATT